ncbi:hypothetical protein BDY24DRAFT_233923 [Mrakia frigida]|uniref:uncharacterized protein n=1 Tax=Mrakia frigida TaxID=29902 RepID=UPI003FCC0712
MDPDAPPPLLTLSPLLRDVSNWLSLPESTAQAPTPPSSSTTAASSMISAGFLNLLPGGSRSTTPSIEDTKPSGDPPKPPKKVRCRSVEAYGNNLYMGTSDGQVLWYTFDPVGTSTDPYTLKHRHTLFPRKSVDRIFLLPSISKVLVLSESTLHFLTLPSLDPIPTALIQSIRGVITVALDESHHDLYSAEGSGDEVGICVIKRRGISVYRLGSRLFSVKEIPLPSPPLLARYYSPTMCIADLETYSFVSIPDSTLSPVMPISQVQPNFVPKPCIAVVQVDEFLATSCTSPEGAGMGVFLNGEGDPVRGTIQWDSFPKSVVIQPPYIISLLRNQTIQIHSLLTLDVLQLIHLPPSLEARSLFRSPTGFVVPSPERDALLHKVLVPLLRPRQPDSFPLPDSLPTSPSVSTNNLNNTSEANTVPTAFIDPPSGSGLTPPSSPRRSYNSTRTSSSSFSYNASTSSSPPSNPSSSQRSNVLILSPSSIHALTPTPPLTLALQALSSSSSANASSSGDSTLSNALAPLLLAASISEDGAQDVEAVKFVHQKVFLKGLKEARFGGEQADIWEMGGGDVRLVVRLFGELRAVLELEKEGGEGEENAMLEVEVEEGLKEEWSGFWDVEEMVQENLRRNYHPHIEPDVETSPSTTELRNVLLGQAREMLRGILVKERELRSRRSSKPVSGGKRSKQVVVEVARTRKEEILDRVIDTSLLILLARIGSTLSILDILESKHYADPSLVRDALEREQRWFALGRCSDGEESLEIFTAIADGSRPDDDCVRDPVDEVLSILAASEDAALVRKYGLWVVKRDWERGLELFTHSGLDFDDGELVDELRALDDRAGDKYLEHVVIVKKSTDRVLHTSMAVRYVDVLCRYLKDPLVEKEFANAVSAYSSAPASTSFLTFLASFLPDSPHKRLRFKTILFIQGSQLYDIDAVRNRLEHEPALSVLSTERAIIFGKLHLHDEALYILARTLRDSISAAAFCTQGGEVVPARVGQTIAHDLGLDAWAALGGGAIRRRMTVTEETRRELLMTLLRIYMGQGEGSATASRTAKLLNDQSIHLEVVEVLDLIPEPWPLQPMSSFLTRSIRRTLHDKHEGQILKALATSENLATLDLAFEVLRSLPPVLKTSPPSPSSQAASDDGYLERERAEKGSLVEILAEKIGHGVEGQRLTVDVGLRGGEEGKERLTVSPSGYGPEEDDEEEGLA